MNKAELIEAVSEKTGLSKNKAAEALSAVLDTITEQLAKGSDVRVVGFGTFETTKRAARTGRNPQTGKAIQIDEAILPKFKPGKELKDACASK